MSNGSVITSLNFFVKPRPGGFHNCNFVCVLSLQLLTGLQTIHAVPVGDVDDDMHADASEMQVGKTSLVVGLAAMSFNSATREQMPTLQPPDHAAYLSNIAVEPRFRRYDHSRPLQPNHMHLCIRVYSVSFISFVECFALQFRLSDPSVES